MGAAGTGARQQRAMAVRCVPRRGVADQGPARPCELGSLLVNLLRRAVARLVKEGCGSGPWLSAYLEDQVCPAARLSREGLPAQDQVPGSLLKRWFL